MSIILRTKAWHRPPPPPEMPSVPFELIKAHYVVPAARVVGFLAKPLGIPALAAFGPQAAVFTGGYLGASGIRHLYRVGATHPQRLAQHKLNVAQWLSQLPPVRHERAESLDDIEHFHLQLRRGEFGTGSTIEIHGDIREKFVRTYQAACILMKKHDKYHDIKNIPLLAYDMFKLAQLLTSTTSLAVETVAQFKKTSEKLSKQLKHVHNELWDDRWYVSFEMAEMILEFVVNGAYIVKNDGRKIIISYGVERTKN